MSSSTAAADPLLTTRAVALLRDAAAVRLAERVRVRWNPRLRSTAGRAFTRENLVELNPRLTAFPGETERTLRHELAHLLATWRAAAAAVVTLPPGGRGGDGCRLSRHGRSRRRRRPIAPHGPEWRRACADLGIADEGRCHRLELAPRRRVARPHVYRCAGCGLEWRRARPISRRRPLACRACCRAHARGRFDRRFQFVPTGALPPSSSLTA